jgi:lipid A 4'-phosphatase
MLKHSIVWIFIVLGIALFLFPKLDVMFTHAFYSADLGFVHKNNHIVVLCFRLVPIVTTIFGVLCMSYITYFAFKGKRIVQMPVMYLLVAVVLGPGLFVNYALKDHIGRARPSQILEFGGNKAFVGPLRISNECEHNCSFSSGHAAMGYYFSGISYVVPPQYQTLVFALGIALGSVIGLGRIAQGGHFLSDVVFSGIFIMLINHLCFVLWRKTFKRIQKTKNKKVTVAKKKS